MSLDQILISILILWLIVLTILFIRLLNHYNKLTAGVNQKDLITSLNHFISLSVDNQEAISRLSGQLTAEVEENKKHLQKIGFNRYNPFTDTGGDQSFSAAFLDEMGTGIVISSLHSRENTRLYAKKVVKGKVEGQATSTEEQSVIKEALK